MFSNKMKNLLNELQNNETGVNYPYEIWYRKSDWEISVKSSVLILIVFFGVFVNSSVLMAILNKRQIGVPINFFFVSTAIADIATLLTSPPMILCQDIFQNYELGPFGCKFEAFIEVALLLIDVLNLVFITCIRLMAIAMPQKMSLRRRNIHTALIITWVIAIASTLPLVAYRSYKERVWKNFTEKYCQEDNTNFSLYWNILVVVMIWMPLAVMLISYCVVFCNFDQFTVALEQQHPRHRIKYRKRAVKIIFAVVVIFCLCRLPFTVLILWKNNLLQDSITHTNFETLWFIAHTLLFTNAAINPILYGLTNRDFQNSLRQSRILGWVFKKPHEQITNNPIWTVPRLTPRRLSGRSI